MYIARYPHLLAEVHLDYFGRGYRRKLELFCPDGSYLAIVSDGSMQTKLYRYFFDPTLSAPANTLEVWSLEENAKRIWIFRYILLKFSQSSQTNAVGIHSRCTTKYRPARQQCHCDFNTHCGDQNKCDDNRR